MDSFITTLEKIIICNFRNYSERIERVKCLYEVTGVDEAVSEDKLDDFIKYRIESKQTSSKGYSPLYSEQFQQISK